MGNGTPCVAAVATLPRHVRHVIVALFRTVYRIVRSHGSLRGLAGDAELAEVNGRWLDGQIGTQTAEWFIQGFLCIHPSDSTAPPHGVLLPPVWEVPMDDHAEEYIVPYASSPWEQAEQSRLNALPTNERRRLVHAANETVT